MVCRPYAWIDSGLPLFIKAEDEPHGKLIYCQRHLSHAGVQGNDPVAVWFLGKKEDAMVQSPLSLRFLNFSEGICTSSCLNASSGCADLSNRL
jgi:hypothetical protein